MRRLLPIAVFLMVALWIATGAPGFAQQSGSADTAQPAPDAPQPQKKKADKKETSNGAASTKAGSGAAPASSNPAAADNESASQTAGQTTAPASAQGASTKSASSDSANPFPEDVSRRAAQAAAPGAATPSAPTPLASKTNANPFPEAVSRRAAQAAGNAAPADTKTPPATPPGSSNPIRLENLGDSSSSNAIEVTDPVRAKRDTQVGDFYLSRGDATGAYMRYKDALAHDPTNMDAVYGLAEAALRLKKFSEAERNYQLYLEVIPTGGKARHALKELSALAQQK